MNETKTNLTVEENFSSFERNVFVKAKLKK